MSIKKKYSVFLTAIISVFWFGLPCNILAQPGTNDTCTKAQMESGTKRALLVGISKYDKGRTGIDVDWWDLHTKADIEVLADVLIHRFKFKPENIKILSDEKISIPANTETTDQWIKIPSQQPTHAAIEAAFQTFLIKDTKPCDTIYFHFSGHGQRIPDDGSDELDGYDETIVPIDYVSQKDGSKNIRDDEIGKWLDALDTKNPATATISLDSCFAGDATRGDEKSRGGPWKGPVPPAIKLKDRKNGDDNSPGDFIRPRGSGRGGASRPANYVFLSASSSNQTAKEFTQEVKGENVQTGIFTFSLAKAMEKATENTTYRDIHERVNDFITARKPDQNPQIQGKQVDNLVLGYGAEPVKPFLTVKVVGGSAVLQAGKLQGVTRGSKFALHRAETKEHKENAELAMAEVTNVLFSSAELKILKNNVSPEQLTETAARAFETLHSYEDVLRVRVENGVPDLSKVFSDLGILTKANATDAIWNVRIRPVAPKDKTDKLVPADFRGILIERKEDGSIIKTVLHNAPDLADQITAGLNAEAKRITLKSLESTDSSLPVSFRLVPVNVDFTEHPDGRVKDFIGVTGDKQEGLTRRANGLIEFKIGEWVQFEVTNLSPVDVYVSILNLQSDGQINAAFPRGGCPDNRIAAKSKPLRIDCALARISKPTGQESFRVIATRVPTDFSPLANQEIVVDARGRGEPLEATIRSRGTRGDVRVTNALDSPLGKILLAARENGKRSDTYVPQGWTVVTVNYVVIPK